LLFRLIVGAWKVISAVKVGHKQSPGIKERVFEAPPDKDRRRALGGHTLSGGDEVGNL
jgi:hypothetical protein